MAERHGDTTMAGNGENSSRNSGGWGGHPWRIVAWAGAGIILLLPLVAMRFTDEVNWTVSDFIFAGALIVGTGMVYELTVWVTRNTAYRAAVGIALAAVFMLIWFSGAVGIIGSEDNQANLMYAGVLVVGIIGPLVARFRPRGMAYTLFAMAFVQALIGVIALAGGLGSTGPIWPLDIIGLTGFFVALLVGSGLLFWKAAGGYLPQHSSSN